MNDLELRKKEDRLYLISCIPSIILCVIISLVFSYHLKTAYPQGSQSGYLLWEMIIYFLIPLVMMAPFSFFLTFEVLHYRNTKKSLIFHIRRFVGRVIIQLVAATIFITIYVILLVFLLPLTSPAIVLVVISLAWSLLFYSVTKKFRKTFHQLEKGEW